MHTDYNDIRRTMRVSFDPVPGHRFSIQLIMQRILCGQDRQSSEPWDVEVLGMKVGESFNQGDMTSSRTELAVVSDMRLSTDYRRRP